MNIGIILASGKSNRYGKKIPKQFNFFNNKMVIEYSVNTFLKHPNINKVIIVVPKFYLEEIKNKFKECIVIEGGKRRQDSSFIGLKHCPKNTNNVLIHDAARPFVNNKIIQDCIEKLNDNIAVCPALPCSDTIAELNKNNIFKILDRNILYKLQTPQAFNYKILLECHKKLNNNVTDDISIIKKQGYDCKIINGNIKNMKITYKEDLKILQGLI